MTETYKVYTQYADGSGFTCWYEGPDHAKAFQIASAKFGFVVRESDKAIDGEDGWTGRFDPSFRIPVAK